MDFEFPRVIYKSGTTVEIDGCFFDYQIIETPEQFEKLKLDGWRLDPSTAKNLIDTAAEIAFPQAESGDHRTVADVDAQIKVENALIREQLRVEESEAEGNELSVTSTAKNKKQKRLS